MAETAIEDLVDARSEAATRGRATVLRSVLVPTGTIAIARQAAFRVDAQERMVLAQVFSRVEEADLAPAFRGEIARFRAEHGSAEAYGT